MRERFAGGGSALATLVSLGLAGVGGYGYLSGVRPAEFAVAMGLLAVTVLLGYRSVAVQATPCDVNALGNVALFVAGSGLYVTGVELALEPVETAGEAVFAMALTYFVVRLDGL